MNVGLIFSSAAQLTFATIIVRSLSFLSFPILTRLLKPEAYGVASLATTFVGIFVIIGLSGQDASYVKCYFDKENYQQTDVDSFYYRYAVFAGLAAAGLAMAAWLIYVGQQNIQASSWVALFVGIGVVGGIVSTFCQARARLIGLYRRMTWTLIASGVLSTLACIYVAMNWQPNELALMTAVISSWVIVVLLPQGTVRTLFRKSSLSTAQVRRMVKIGLPLLATAPGYWVISSSDRWFVAAYSGAYELGIYSVGLTVAMMGQMVTSALCNVWYPAVSKQMHDPTMLDHKKLALTQTLICWLLMATYFLISLFGADVIKLLASSKFQGAAHYIPVLSMGLCFYGINQFQGFGFTMMGKNHLIPAIWGVAMAVSLCANWILVPIFGANGAAFSQMISYLVLALLTRHFAKKYMPFEPDWPRLGIVLALFMLTCAIFLSVDATGAYWMFLIIKSTVALLIISLTLLLIYPAGAKVAIERAAAALAR